MVELFPDAVGLYMAKSVKLNVTFHEDNYGAYILADTDTPQHKLWSVKMVWWQEYIKKREIMLKMIETKDQEGYIMKNNSPLVYFK